MWKMTWCFHFDNCCRGACLWEWWTWWHRRTTDHKSNCSSLYSTLPEPCKYESYHSFLSQNTYLQNQFDFRSQWVSMHHHPFYPTECFQDWDWLWLSSFRGNTWWLLIITQLCERHPAQKSVGLLPSRQKVQSRGRIRWQRSSICYLDKFHTFSWYSDGPAGRFAWSFHQNEPAISYS